MASMRGPLYLLIIIFVAGAFAYLGPQLSSSTLWDNEYHSCARFDPQSTGTLLDIPGWNFTSDTEVDVQLRSSQYMTVHAIHISWNTGHEWNWTSSRELFPGKKKTFSVTGKQLPETCASGEIRTEYRLQDQISSTTFTNMTGNVPKETIVPDD
jgi:hypothetical protein